MKIPSIPNNSILGINYSGMHDSAISIVSPTGKVIFASSLERVTRVKQDGRPPYRLLELIDFSKISKIGVSADKELDKSLDMESKIHPLRLPFSNDSQSDYLIHDKPFYDFFSKFDIPVHFVCHQLSHASSAFWMSGLKEATCFTYDGGMNNSLWFGAMYNASLENGIQVLDRFSITKYAKITTLYSVITGLLGFTPNKHEGKVTGLAAFGKRNEKCESILMKMLSEDYKKIEGLGEWFFTYSNEKPPAYFVDPERRKEILSQFDGISKEDIAHNLQRISENHVIEIFANAKKENFLSKSICLAGGLFANVKINQRVKEFGFENIFVVPPMTDDGAGLGAALYLASQNKEFQPQKIDSMFLGFDFSKSEIEDSLTQHGIVFEKVDNPIPLIVDALNVGSIIGIFQGKMEFGPRSLGNRTIIGQANRKEINTELNDKLRRTEFMPFAPITRIEDAKDCYIGFSGAEFTAEFMTITFQCTKEMIEKSPAVVHIDDTARPEFIRKETNLLLYNILTAYKEKTGIASLINTSFNIHEEPIVCSPDDAIIGFLESGLDYLYLEGGYFVSFEANIKNALHQLQKKGQAKSQKEELYQNALDLYSGRFNQIFLGLKDKERKILEQQDILAKQDLLIKAQDTSQKEKDLLIKAQDTSQKEKDLLIKTLDASQKEKDALIHRHHFFAHELMAELRNDNYNFKTLWPSDRYSLLSIVIPTYNQGQFIADCLDSIINQTYKDLEIIIQDSMSTDSTEKICLEYAAKDSRIRYFREKDSGQSDAINRGLKKSTGEFWTWICSDDRYTNLHCLEKLATILKYSNSNEVMGVYGDAFFISESGEFVSDYGNLKKDLIDKDFQLTWPLSQPSSILVRKRVEEVGGVVEALNLGMDLDLFLKMLNGNFKFKYVDVAVADVRLQDNSKSVKYRKATALNALDLVKKYFGSIGELNRSDYFKELQYSSEIGEIRKYLSEYKFSYRIKYLLLAFLLKFNFIRIFLKSTLQFTKRKLKSIVKISLQPFPKLYTLVARLGKKLRLLK